MDKWLVSIKGDYARGNHEISVIRESNLHGFRSHGWFELDRKILISSSGGPCQDRTTKKIWDKLLKVAQETDDEMNTEQSSDSAEGKP